MKNGMAFPFRGGGAAFAEVEDTSSTQVPALYDVAIAGRPFMLDWDSKDLHGPTSQQITRTQADTTARPDESSLSRDNLWRRMARSWHHGAGQPFLDGQDPGNDNNVRFKESDPFRFRKSLGVNVWTERQLTLLNDTTLSSSNASFGRHCLVNTGNVWYHGAGTTVKSTSGVGSSNLGGSLPGTITAMASDGNYLYVGTSTAVWRMQLTGSHGGTLVAYIGSGVQTLGFCNGRLMAAGVGADTNKIYNITGATLGTAVFTAPDGMLVSAFSEGPSNIYAAAYQPNGAVGYIYRLPLEIDTTELDVARIALPLPDGELPLSLVYYLGFIIIGTNRGVRLAQPSATGDLQSGANIPAASNVYALEPQDQFVWFGWTNYDGSHTGLGRLDLTEFTDPMVPAYASDLMAATTGAVFAVITFGSTRIFAVQGVGAYAEATTPVALGTIETGVITYGMPDPKILDQVDVRHSALPSGGSVQVEVSNGTTYTILGSSTTAGATGIVFRANELRSDRHEIRLTLAASSGVGPTVERITLFALPAPYRGLRFSLPLMLHEKVTLGDNQTQADVDIDDALEFIRQLCVGANRRITTLQWAGTSYRAWVEDFDFVPYGPTLDRRNFNGTCLVLINVPSDEGVA